MTHESERVRGKQMVVSVGPANTTSSPVPPPLFETEAVERVAVMLHAEEAGPPLGSLHNVRVVLHQPVVPYLGRVGPSKNRFDATDRCAPVLWIGNYGWSCLLVMGRNKTQRRSCASQTKNLQKVSRT